MCSKLIKILLIFLIFSLFFFFPQNISAQVVINEFSSYESSGDWVELYSPEYTEISGWYLEDSVSMMTSKPIPEKTFIGSTASSSAYYVVEVGDRLNKTGDIIKLFKPGVVDPINTIPYGGHDQVCAPEVSQSAGRVDNGNTIERFATPTKNATNVGAQLDPCPTPTPEPTTESSTQTPTPTPTVMPSPTKTPTPIPVKTKTPTPTATPTESTTPSSLVLGVQNETATPEATSSSEAKNKIPILSFILIFLGLGFIGGAGYLVYRNSKGYNGIHGENKENS